ncbi:MULTISPECIES: DNA recombination protein RmuC [unclassified Polynucleobacter]|uniref:DNA recombination protein RmuC n=1 Tax=unclassified Polynucleobacter TaxID=2640945 RepID=UPI0024919C43|nr:MULTISPECIES: DNA recombination protein RmuC [unclassified Polynucleobacter]
MTNISWVLLIVACITFSVALFFGLSYRKSLSQADAFEIKSSELQVEVQSLSNQLTKVSAELDSEKRISQEKLEQFNESKKQLTDHFRNLAQDILEEKSQRFATQNQQNLDLILKPLQEKISDFRKRVDDVYSEEVKERASLQAEIHNLTALNLQMSQDANALTKALRGDSKAQGNWGELVLETILENCGLRKGHEFDVQDTQRTEEGNVVYPDVVIHLPESKHVVIDSKVSIAAYTRSVQTDDPDLQKVELTAHVNSIRAHMNGLSAKNYQSLYGLGSIDFVLMFIPIEPAFLAAIGHQSSLFQDALAKNIVLVCPSTLHATVRTIAHVWRQEHQNRNALEIARLCGAMYDKFVGFVDDLDGVGKSISQTQKNYDEAYKKLTTGNGNLVRSAQRVKELGVKPNKSLPNALIEKLEEE